MNWWVHSAYEDGGFVPVFSWAFWVIASIVLHELSHGWAAIANGDDTPREMGHMTIDPVVHMGWMSLAFFAIAGFAWGLMPTNPSRYRHERRGRVLVAAAGPAMNVVLAGLAIVAGGAWVWAVQTGRVAPEEATAANVTKFLYIGAFINLVLGVLNLLPVPPLDGAAILAGASRRLDRFYDTPAVRMYGLIVVLVLFFGAVLRPVQHAMAVGAVDAMSWVSHTLIDRLPGALDASGEAAGGERQ
jgi:Zn-dependent protease